MRILIPNHISEYLRRMSATVRGRDDIPVLVGVNGTAAVSIVVSGYIVGDKGFSFLDFMQLCSGVSVKRHNTGGADN